jgi:multisubunit Na+/H+ antiporter MnhB subunit
MRLLILLLVLVGAFVLVAMFVAPYEPTLRTWYLQNACPHMDRLSTDICAPARREAGSKPA